jgi:hypothetical protein
MAYQRVTSSDTFNSGATSAVTLVNAHSAGIEALENSAVYNVKNYGAVGDGTTDDYTAVMAAINAAHTAGGGIVMFPIGTYRINSQIVMPNLGTGTLYQQNPITLRGMTSQYSGYLDGNMNIRGSVLDLRYSGSDPKLCTYGLGLLTVENLTITDLGTSSNAFVYTTLTTLRTSNITIEGNPSKSGATCNQDAIILGGTNLSYDNTASSPFSGYGTVIDQVRFSRIRRAVYGRTYCNAVVITHCTVDSSCGAALGKSTSGTATGSSGVSTITMSSTTGTIKVGQLVSGTGVNSSQVYPTYVTAISGTAPTQTVTLSNSNDAAVSGTVTFLDVYAPFEIDGTIGFALGNVLSNNLIEHTNYMCAFLFRTSGKNTGYGNSVWDLPAVTTGYAYGTSGTNTLTMMATSGTLAVGQMRSCGINIAPFASITSLSGSAPTQTVTLSTNHNSNVGATTTATGTSGQTSITTNTATTGTITAGQLVQGTGIGTNAYVTAVSGTAPNQTVALSVANSGTVSGTINFGTFIQFDQIIANQLDLNSVGNTGMISYGDFARLRPTSSPSIINGNVTGSWGFSGTHPNQNNNYPIIGIQPAFALVTQNARMFNIGRSSSEPVNPGTSVFSINYDGNVYTNGTYIALSTASGQTTYDYQSIVRSTGNFRLYAGDDNSSVNMSRGVFKDRLFTTAGRPSASTVGAGSCYYDTTLSKPVWSDGTNWKDASGTTV